MYIRGSIIMKIPFVFVLSYATVTKLHLYIEGEYQGYLPFDKFEDGLAVKNDLIRFINETAVR